MKIQKTLLLLLQISLIKSGESKLKIISKLYNLPGVELPAEFPSLASKQLVEKDMEQFGSLGPYKPTQLDKINQQDKMAGVRITQQILRQGSKFGAMDFFKPSVDKKDSAEANRMGHINLEQFYDYETNSYLKNFATPEAKEGMKKMHIDFYTKQEQNANKKPAFFEKREKDFLPRPQKLIKDKPTSFIQIKNKNKIFPLVHLFEYLDLKNCWASSRYEYGYVQTIYYQAPVLKYWWFIPYWGFETRQYDIYTIAFGSYPCSTHTSGWGWWTWISERVPIEEQMKEIVFKLEFESVKRVRVLQVLFMTPPRSVRIESTQDMQNWEVAQEWQDTPDWWRNDWWLLQLTFDPVVYAYGMKIVMKGFRDNYYGDRHIIREINAYSQQQTIMFIERQEGDVPFCMVRAENLYNFENKPMIMMSAFDAIMQNDSREIYWLDILQIKQWADNMCIAPQDPDGDKPQYIVSQNCNGSEKQEWIIDRLGKIQSRQWMGKGLASFQDDSISQVQSYGFVTVSATIGDDRANPYNVVDPNGYGWWAPPLDVSHAYFELVFDRPYMVENIKIVWKTKPPLFELQILAESNEWKTLITEEPDDDIDLEIAPQQIVGIKVLMLDLDQRNADSQATNSDTVYGIKKIYVIRPGTAMSLQTIDSQEGNSRIMNRFKVEEVEYINIEYQVPYRLAEEYMEEQYQDSIENIRTFMEHAPQFSEVLDRAEKIKDVIQSMMGKLQSMIKTLEDFEKEIKQMCDKNAKDQVFPYAQSPKNPASSCFHILEKSPQKLNGYFWVKMKCMPEPARVFCDFQNNFPNFYLYTGNPKEKKTPLENTNSVQDLRVLCGELGLEPIEIKSEGAFLSMIQYLEESGSSSEDGLGIPIAYKYDVGPDAQFRSLNDRESPVCFDAFKKYVHSSILSQTDPNANAYVLVDYKDQVKLVNLKDQKIRGVVCGPNLEPPNPAQKTEIPITCKDDINTVSANIGSTQSFVCPVKCADIEEFKVYGMKDKKFSEHSSICRAAAYLGLTNDNEESIVKIKVAKLKEDYKEEKGEQNKVKSIKCAEITAKYFEFVVKHIEEECPNLDKKESFLSFQEIVKKVENKPENKVFSFIQENEKVQNKDMSKEKTLLDQQMKERTDAVSRTKKDDDDEQSGSKSMATSMTGIRACKAGLKKKLSHTDTYLKYIEDSDKLISENTKKLESVYNSDLSPEKQGATTDQIGNSWKQVKEQAAQIMDSSIACLRRSQQDLLLKIEEYLKLKRYDSFADKYKLSFESLYEDDDSKQALPASKWGYSNDNVFPHKQAISQPMVTSCRDQYDNPQTECSATQLTIKFKNFYDFVLTLDIKATAYGGFIGIIFRKKDAFNYYSLDISKDQMRFRKMINGVQKVISFSKIDQLLSEKWYNLELKVIQNKFSVKFGIEKVDSTAKYGLIPPILKGEDLYIVSGSIGLQTDNIQGALFDNFKIEHEDCYVDPFDSEDAKKYTIKTNRYHDVYRTEIDQIWEQHKDDQNKWIYKDNFFDKKFCMWKKALENEKTPPAFLFRRQFDIGSIYFELLFSKGENELDFYLYYSSSKENILITITPFKIKVIQHEAGQATVLYSGKIKFKFFSWTKMFFGATETNITCAYHDADEDKLVPCFEKEVSRPIKPENYRVGFKCKLDVCAIFDLRIDMLSVDFLEAEVKAEEEEEIESEEVEQFEEIKPIALKKSALAAKPLMAMPVFENDNNIDYQKCIVSETPEQRESFCSEMFGGEKKITSKCSENFCVFCCESKFPKNMVSEKNVCIEECDKAEEPDELDAFNNCANPYDPQHAVAKFCQEEYEKKEDKWRIGYCQLDMCQMCCITTALQFNTDVIPDQIAKCEQQCKNKFFI